MVRVLVVDDAAFMRMIIKDILLENQYEVAGEAENGRQAVDLYDKLEPDVVTMDITMPEMDGIEALKEIRTKHPNAKVLVVSAMGQQKLVVEALEAGAADFLIKPFQPSKVVEALEKCFAKAS